MKNVIFVAILLIVLGTAWTLYLEYDKKRFIDSLPQPPATVTQPVSTADAPATSTSIVTTAAEPAPPETVVEDTLTESEQAHPHPHTDSLEPTEEAGRFDDDMFSDSEIPSDLVDLPLPQTKEPRRHWKELSKEELYERRKQALIRKHGDIPEVEIYLKQRMYPKPYLTMEEFNEQARAMLILFPSENNRRKLEPLMRKGERSR